MSVAEMIFTQLVVARQIFVKKNSYTKLH